ncbi:23568_t:CDS:1 [Gigaspora margarita]|uniref:23568_t:CDS:1 n=1 Tax=Gigaspora margarita TaxID=4874 RepID=A0ABM8W0Q7_GIGMA|nr:23568_t:CDS:1 [Gigaspora margarita]
MKNEGKQIDVHTKPLEIHWCIIITKQEYKGITWKIDKHSMYKGQEWNCCDIKGDIKKRFFSILYNEENCSPVFANANSEYPILHLFSIESEKNIIFRKSKSEKKNMESYISYLIIP